MGLSQIVAGVSALLTGLLPMSCRHAAPASASGSPAPASTTASAGADSSNTNMVVRDPFLHDLGPLTLTNHVEHCVKFSGGKECILYPKLVNKHTVKLTVTYESVMPGGQVHDVIVSQVDAKLGEPLKVTLGTFKLALTPDVADE